MKKNSILCRRIFLTTVLIWTIIFAVLPILLTFVTSLLATDVNKTLQFIPTFDNYLSLVNYAYVKVFSRSLYMSIVCTLICLIIAYPFAFIISRCQSKHRSLLLLLVIIPSWTSSLIRTYAIMAILKTKGILNSILLALGIIDQPMQLLYSHTAVLVGLVYDLLPFMILPLYVNIEKLNPEYLEAAKDLGANSLTTFSKVIIPQTKQGIVSGCILVFLPSMTIFYIPILLGGAKNLLIGNLVEYQFLSANNWPLGTALSCVITLLMMAFILIHWKSSNKTVRRKYIL